LKNEISAARLCKTVRATGMALLACTGERLGTVKSPENHLSIQQTAKVNSAFHPSKAGKSNINTGLHGWVQGRAHSPVSVVR